MPTYDYKCPGCGHIEEVVHSIKKDPVINCQVCGIMGDENRMERLISRNTTGFIFKNGGTPSMAWKEKRLRHKKNKDLELRQIERYGSGPRIQPNVGGVEVDSWSDAQSMAKEAGLNAESYKPMVEKEKHVSKTSNIDDRAWKKAKENKDK